MSDTWCVYQPDWAEVARANPPVGRDDLVALFNSSWKGKVGPDDWRLSPVNQEPSVWILEVKLPNLRAEFKDKEMAKGHASVLGEDAVVVPWGSKDEEKLLTFGIT